MKLTLGAHLTLGATILFGTFAAAAGIAKDPVLPILEMDSAPGSVSVELWPTDSYAPTVYADPAACPNSDCTAGHADLVIYNEGIEDEPVSVHVVYVTGSWKTDLTAHEVIAPALTPPGTYTGCGSTWLTGEDCGRAVVEHVSIRPVDDARYNPPESQNGTLTVEVSPVDRPDRKTQASWSVTLYDHWQLEMELNPTWVDVQEGCSGQSTLTITNLRAYSIDPSIRIIWIDKDWSTDLATGTVSLEPGATYEQTFSLWHAREGQASGSITIGVETDLDPFDSARFTVREVPYGASC